LRLRAIPLKAEIRLVRDEAGWRATVETRYGKQEERAAGFNEALGAAVRLLWEGGDLGRAAELALYGEDEGRTDGDDGRTYELCARCDHFVDFHEETTERGVRAGYAHLDDGEQDYDHAAEPSNVRKTLAEWRRDRPGLFTLYPDGKVGPNSAYHEPRGQE
jgi:hypothetical protein